jgi:hypothetical protein
VLVVVVLAEVVVLAVVVVDMTNNYCLHYRVLR